jgi:hypothetical protein
MDVKEYKTFRQEIKEKLPPLENLPSISPNSDFPRGSLGLVLKESTDDVAKSVLFREYETSFIPNIGNGLTSLNRNIA